MSDYLDYKDLRKASQGCELPSGTGVACQPTLLLWAGRSNIEILALEFRSAIVLQDYHLLQIICRAVPITETLFDCRFTPRGSALRNGELYTSV